MPNDDSDSDGGISDDMPLNPDLDDMPDHLLDDDGPTKSDSDEGGDDPFSDTETPSDPVADENADDSDPTDAEPDDSDPTDADGATSDTSATDEPDIDALRDRMDNDGISVDGLNLGRRGFMLGAGAALTAALTGSGAAGWFLGERSAHASLEDEREAIDAEREEMRQQMNAERKRLRAEYTRPTTNDERVKNVDESVEIRPNSFEHYYLELDKETLLDLRVSASSRVDLFFMDADEFGKFRNKDNYAYNAVYSELDTTQTRDQRVVLPGWYALVIDNTDQGGATPPARNHGRVTADIELSAYQQPDAPEEEGVGENTSTPDS